jgi:hypothetical protein
MALRLIRDECAGASLILFPAVFFGRSPESGNWWLYITFWGLRIGVKRDCHEN